MKKILLLGLAVLLCVALCSCGAQKKASLWDTAIYTEDTELGSGAKTLKILVEAEDKSITFTLHTDAKTVGEALKEHKLVAGENTVYGLYIKSVNGMTADYAKTQTYWAFNQNGEGMPTSVDGAEFQDGDSFELVVTK